MKKVNLLNFKTLLLILIFGFVSCSSDENENDFDLNARYIHLIEDCDTSNVTEINCTEFIEFNELGNADVLIGGGDIVFRTKYYVEGSKVELEQASGLNFDISFTILDDMTLKRTEDGEIWEKDN